MPPQLPPQGPRELESRHPSLRAASVIGQDYRGRLVKLPRYCPGRGQIAAIVMGLSTYSRWEGLDDCILWPWSYELHLHVQVELDRVMNKGSRAKLRQFRIQEIAH